MNSHQTCIIEAVSLVMRNNIFEFGDCTFKQLVGSAIGTPVPGGSSNDYNLLCHECLACYPIMDDPDLSLLDPPPSKDTLLQNPPPRVSPLLSGPVLSHFFIRLEGLPSISSCLTKEDAGALNSEDSCAYVVSRDRGSRCFFLPSTVFRVRRNRWITLTLTSAKTLLPRFSLLTPPGLRRPTQLTLRDTTSRP